jgi:hypothetical protein
VNKFFSIYNGALFVRRPHRNCAKIKKELTVCPESTKGWRRTEYDFVESCGNFICRYCITCDDCCFVWFIFTVTPIYFTY